MSVVVEEEEAEEVLVVVEWDRTVEEAVSEVVVNGVEEGEVSNKRQSARILLGVSLLQQYCNSCIHLQRVLWLPLCGY